MTVSRATARRRFGLHEDVVATILGLAIVALALVVTWAARPDEAPGSREAWPKGWLTPLARTIDKPQTWGDSPLESLRDRKGRSVTPSGRRAGAAAGSASVTGAEWGAGSVSVNAKRLPCPAALNTCSKSRSSPPRPLSATATRLSRRFAAGRDSSQARAAR